MLSNRLKMIIYQQTHKILDTIEDLLINTTDALLYEFYTGMPLWYFYYQMLYSLDQWIFNVDSFIDPDFYLNRKNFQSMMSQKGQLRREMLSFFDKTRDKIEFYLKNLDKIELTEKPEDRAFSRWEIIHSQNCHLSYYTGFITCCLNKEWNKLQNFNAVIKKSDINSLWN